MSMIAELEVALGLKGLAAVEGGLGQVDRSLRQVGDTGERTGGIFSKVGGAVAGAFDFMGKAGLAVFAVEQGVGLIEGAFKAALGPSVDFEHTLSGIRAVSHASAGDMALLKAKALEYGQSSALANISTMDAARSFEELAKAGLSASDIVGGAGYSALLLASAGGLDVAEASKIASDAMHAFHLTAGDMPHVADVIAGAANASSIDVREFGFSMQQASAMAYEAGQTIDQTAAAFALLGNSGIRGSDAGTSARVFLQQLIPQTKQQRAAMESAGLWVAGTMVADPATAAKAEKADTDFARRQQERQIKVRSLEQDIAAEQAKRKPNLEAIRHKQEEIAKIQRDIGADAPKGVKTKFGEVGGHSIFVNDDGTFKSFQEQAALLHEKLAGKTQAQRTDLLHDMFGQDGERFAAVLMEAGGEGFADILAQMQGVTAEGVGKARNDNLFGDLAQLGDSWDALRIRFGDTLQPLLRDVVEWGTGMVNAASPAVERFGDILSGLGGLVAPILDAFRSGDFNSAFGPIIETISRLFGSDVAGRVTLFASNLLRGFQLARDGFLTFRAALAGDWFGGKTESINGFVRTLGNLGTIARNVFLAVRAALSGDWGALGAIWQQGIVPALQGLWAVVAPWVAVKVVELRALFLSWGRALADWVTETAWPRLKEKLGEWKGNLETWLTETGIPAARDKLKEFGTAFGDWVLNDAWPAVRDKLPTWIANLQEWFDTTGMPQLTTMLSKLSAAASKALTESLFALGEAGANGEQSPFLRWYAGLWDQAIKWQTTELPKLLLTANGAIWEGVGEGIITGIADGMANHMPDWLRGLLEKGGVVVPKGIDRVQGKAEVAPGGGPTPDEAAKKRGFSKESFGFADAGAGAGGGNTFNLTVNVDGTGIGADEAGSKVAAAIYATLQDLIGGGTGTPSAPAPATSFSIA